MSSSYERYKRQRAAKDIARENISRKKPNSFFTNLKMFILISSALCLAGFVALNLYLSSLPPIPDLEDYKPNIVTKFYSEDGEVIKTFTASGSFSVPDISTNDEVRICAVAEFSVYSYDPAYGNETVSTETATLTEAVLPISASSSNASINISHSGGLISFEFIPYEMNYKGYVNEETPTKITFTVVRKKV